MPGPRSQKRDAKSAKPNQDGFPEGLARPALRALANAGFTRLDDLTGVREEDLLALHGMGPKAIEVLRGALRERGQSFLN